MEYASTVWDPSTEKHIKSVENVQRQAARFVKSDYRRRSSVTTMLESLNWVSLASRRAEAKLVMLYRITNNLVDVTTSTLTAAPTRTRCNTHRYLHSPASKSFSFTVVFSTVSPIVYCASFPSVVSCCTKFEDTWSRKFFG